MPDSVVRARGFRKTETSLKSEGMNPCGTPHYKGIKKRIIDGDICYEQGRVEIFDYHSRLIKSDQA